MASNGFDIRGSFLCGRGRAVRGFDPQVKNVNHSGFEISPAPLGLIDGDDIACQTVFGQAKAYELFEFLDPARAADFVVVPVESETDAQIPAEPDAGHHQTDQSRYQRPPQPQ